MARLRHIFRLLFLPLIMLKRAGDLLHDRCFRAGYRAGWLLCGAPADSQPDKTGR